MKRKVKLLVNVGWQEASALQLPDGCVDGAVVEVNDGQFTTLVDIKKWAVPVADDAPKKTPKEPVEKTPREMVKP